MTEPLRDPAEHWKKTEHFALFVFRKAAIGCSKQKEQSPTQTIPSIYSRIVYPTLVVDPPSIILLESICLLSSSTKRDESPETLATTRASAEQDLPPTRLLRCYYYERLRTRKRIETTNNEKHTPKEEQKLVPLRTNHFLVTFALDRSRNQNHEEPPLLAPLLLLLLVHLPDDDTHGRGNNLCTNNNKNNNLCTTTTTRQTTRRRTFGSSDE